MKDGQNDTWDDTWEVVWMNMLVDQRDPVRLGGTSSPASGLRAGIQVATSRGKGLRAQQGRVLLKGMEGVLRCPH